MKGRCKDERENNEHFNVMKRRSHICAQHTRPSVTCQDGDRGERKRENRKADEEKKNEKREDKY